MFTHKYISTYEFRFNKRTYRKKVSKRNMNTVKLFIGRVTLTLVFIYISMVISVPDANEVNIAILQYTILDETILVYVFVSLFYSFSLI